MRNRLSRPTLLAPWMFAALLASLAQAQAPPIAPQQGLREHTPQWFALVGADVVVEPGRILPQATVVVRDGVIIAVGGDAPAGARVVDLAGKRIYAGLIDAYSEAAMSPPSGGTPSWNHHVHPQLDIADQYRADGARNAAYRGQGVVARLVAPSEGILRGASAVVSTGDVDNGHGILRSGVAQHARLTIPRGARDDYPNSPMGAVALARQTMLDARWLVDAERAWRAAPSLPRPERSDALAALGPCVRGEQPLILDAPNELFCLRADAFAEEFSLRAILKGSGHEYKRLAEIQATGRAVIVPLRFPKAPFVGTAEAALSATLAELMHWELAPENPGRLARAGVPIALTAHGLDRTEELLEATRRAVRHGLDADAALRALTTTPARLLGVESLLGTVEPGKLASLVVVDGELFSGGARVVETWVEGRRHEHRPEPLVDVTGTWQLDGADATLRLRLERADDGRLRGTALRGEPAADEVKLGRVALADARLALEVDSKRWGREGTARLSLVVTGDTLIGGVVWPDGAQASLTGRRLPAEPERPRPPDEEPPASPSPPPAPLSVVNFPLGAHGRSAAPEQPERLLLTHATIWTCGPEGTLADASLLVERGRVVAVGRDLMPPPDAVVLDLGGRHVTPGIIDCHSHMATDGGINESAQAITAEVRIGDFIDCDDINIYRQLAGGVTAVNILHGSANPIGGQNQVIKLRWGAAPESLRFAGAPAGIKFALGENVKQSNWGERHTSRYPQTRMGVEQLMRDAFQAAREYHRAESAWRTAPRGLPPRRDLELEALAEVLEGRRWIHCHSYRQDEILALLRVCEDFQVRVGSLQHILEGYKVADAIAAHGATGSSFSDWWAYKFEVFDAIPYNGALMHRAGVVVSFNSDDAELARRLNLEAAKAVKYGGVPPVEALRFVTLNPARQLRIDDRVGSLEPGKDADFVVWSGDPLSTRSRCEQTWIDGRRYFDRQEDLARRAADAQLHNRLVQRVLRGDGPTLKPGEREVDDADLWPREDLFCHAHGHEHGE